MKSTYEKFLYSKIFEQISVLLQSEKRNEKDKKGRHRHEQRDTQQAEAREKETERAQPQPQPQRYNFYSNKTRPTPISRVRDLQGKNDLE